VNFQEFCEKAIGFKIEYRKYYQDNSGNYRTLEDKHVSVMLTIYKKQGYDWRVKIEYKSIDSISELLQAIIDHKDREYWNTDKQCWLQDDKTSPNTQLSDLMYYFANYKFRMLK
jgi:hypothetical protein